MNAESKSPELEQAASVAPHQLEKKSFLDGCTYEILIPIPYAIQTPRYARISYALVHVETRTYDIVNKTTQEKSPF